VSSSDVALAGRSVTFDPVTGRFAVGGDGGVNLAFSGASTVAASAPATSAPPTQSASSSPAASATPTPSPVAPSPSAAAPVAVVPPGLPPTAQLAGDGTYRFALSDNRRPMLVAGAGRMLWVVDDAKRLATVDTTTGGIADVAQLPLDGTYTRLLLGTRYVYAIDQGKGRIAIFSLATGQLDTVAFPFAATAAGVAVGTDDKIWLAGGESRNVLALDPATKAVTAIDFRTTSISALFIDSAARVWYAEEATGGIGHYDQSKQTIVIVPTSPHSVVTALAMDRDGTLWAGTIGGELLSVRPGAAATAGSAGGSVAGLVRDASGGVWSYASPPGTVVYRPLTGGGAARIAAVGVSGLGFDASGRAWLADPVGPGFHIVLNGGK
jgi:hypothetical protein